MHLIASSLLFFMSSIFTLTLFPTSSLKIVNRVLSYSKRSSSSLFKKKSFISKNLRYHLGFGLSRLNLQNPFSSSIISSSPSVLSELSSLLTHTKRSINSLVKPAIYLRGGSTRNLFFTMMSSASVATASNELPSQVVEYFRSDYKPSDYTIKEIFLDFILDESETVVRSTNKVQTQHCLSSTPDLILDGEEVELVSVSINGKVLDKDVDYRINGDKLVIFGTSIDSTTNHAEYFELITTVKIQPDKNLALSGLYKSGASSLLCTQCEAMGFRRITYSLDRPDVLSVYRVRLEADKSKFPLLLSNGNRIAFGDVAGSSRHWALWEDPFPKPSYLFALVAGDLASIHDTYTTTSGRVVQLGIYSDKENADKLDHAMYSLKESMIWDEETFGLECDLDVYNVVATNDFNMGAMENKGLNIFNSAYVLADPKTATDRDYELILGVIGHEYFHNWSGNRVTVRDWFQLTLKEGLTVFRDQWFSADKTSEAVKRIEDVRGLRGRQFAEDSSPMAHPIRPESYISMDNFYTATVYSKGAEIIGIYRTLLGVEGFKKGLALYFERHDGTAVTCDDFRNAMADANGVDLSQLDRWYSQAGTPTVTIRQDYDPVAKKFTIEASQRTPSTPGQKEEDKLPVIIPLVTGLLDASTGRELTSSRVLVLKEAKQTFEFDNIPTKPILSTLRGFSAPVNLELEQSDEELVALMAHDTDSFNAWDASNRYFTKLILEIAKAPLDKIAEYELPAAFVSAVRTLLSSAMTSDKDQSLLAYALQAPDETTLLNQMSPIRVDAVHLARNRVKKALGKALNAEFLALYNKLSSAPSAASYVFSPAEVGRRRLRNTCLDYLSTSGDAAATALATVQFKSAVCMTDKLAALATLVSLPGAERDQALLDFHSDAKGNALVLNKWFSIQALADYDGILDDVQRLKKHPDFTLSNPNRARSLLGAFTQNLNYFHHSSGAGYKFIADAVLEIDKINPQVAARMMSAFGLWHKFDSPRKELMQEQLQRIKSTEKLSSDTFEIVSRYLK